MDLVMVRRLFARALDVIRLYWYIVIGYLYHATDCVYTFIYVILCIIYIYIYCIWYYNHVQRFDSPKIGSKPFGDSNPEHHRPFPIWPPRGTSACGRKSGAVDPAAARSHGPWRVPSHEMMILCHEMMILWRINDDLLGLSIELAILASEIYPKNGGGEPFECEHGSGLGGMTGYGTPSLFSSFANLWTSGNHVGSTIFRKTWGPLPSFTDERPNP